jgi:arylformamidase
MHLKIKGRTNSVAIKTEEMMSVYKMGNLRVVDLTKPLDPETETRRCHLFRYNTGGPIPDFHTMIDITSHLGTHAECPYHHRDDWLDVSALPITCFMGRAVYVSFDEAEPNSYITPELLENACGDKLREDDIIILDSPYKLAPFTEKTNTAEDKRLFVNADTAIWCRDRKVKCVGFGDGVSIENRNEDVAPFHDVLLAENIVFLEVLKNLELLERDVFFMSYSPLYIKGLDSSPVRAYAIEGLAEFS